MLYRLNSTHTIGRRAEVSLGDVLQHVDVARLVGDDPLQTGVLVLEFLEALRVVGQHGAVLVPPAVPGRLGDLEVPANVGHVAAIVEQFLAFGDLANDLFGGVVLSLHGDIFSLHKGALGLSSAVAQFSGSPHVRPQH